MVIPGKLIKIAHTHNGYDRIHYVMCLIEEVIDMLKKIARASALVAGLIGALSIVSCSNTSHAQSGAGIPVIIMGEDSDKRSIPRDSDIFRRVLNELKSQMSRYNFYVIDEEMLAVEFGWKMRKRRQIGRASCRERV